MSKCAQEGALSRKSESHQRHEDITMQKKRMERSMKMVLLYKKLQKSE